MGVLLKFSAVWGRGLRFSKDEKIVVFIELKMLFDSNLMKSLNNKLLENSTGLIFSFNTIIK